MKLWAGSYTPKSVPGQQLAGAAEVSTSASGQQSSSKWYAFMTANEVVSEVAGAERQRQLQQQLQLQQQQQPSWLWAAGEQQQKQHPRSPRRSITPVRPRKNQSFLTPACGFQSEQAVV